MFLTTHDRALPDGPALVDAATGRVWAYRELDVSIAKLAAALNLERKGVVLLLAENTVPSIRTYLAALESGHAVLPMEADIDPAFLRRLIDGFVPEVVAFPVSFSRAAEVVGGANYAPIDVGEPSLSVWRRPAPRSVPIHEDLSLLLATSGSTGNPKLVRLSRRNILSNANSIRSSLDIGRDERAITSLPPFYSYGLSVLHSHLLAGASVVVTTESIAGRSFWDAFRSYGCTSCAAIPYMYDIFGRIGFERLELPTLRTLTQAGGKLADPLISRFHAIMKARGGRLMVMYGQTEATARIACLPSHLLPAKLGSVGFPLGGGRIAIQLDEGGVASPRSVGEVVYSGPNVMLGYAIERDDLARGDELGGVLHTGDLGYLDDDGCLFIVGRRKRFSKVFGLRVNLDDVEGRLQEQSHVAVVDGGDIMIVCCTAAAEAAVRHRVREVAYQMRVHPSAFVLRIVADLPLLPNGKIDYKALGTLGGAWPVLPPRSNT